MSLRGNSHPILTRGSRVSRAPPHHTLPAFLNLHGRTYCSLQKAEFLRRIETYLSMIIIILVS